MQYNMVHLNNSLENKKNVVGATQNQRQMQPFGQGAPLQIQTQ